jgi:hypothetical protein
LADKLTKVAQHALDRAEKLKGIFNAQTTTSAPTKTKAAPVTATTTRLVPPLGFEGLSLRETPTGPAPLAVEPAGAKSGNAHGYTEEEKKVLASTSMINGREYVPFMDSVDLKERYFHSKIPSSLCVN